MNRNTIIVAGIAAALVLALAVFFAFRPSEVEPTQPRVTVAAENTAPNRGSVPAPQVVVPPLELRQNGLYTIDMNPYVTASLSENYSFIHDALKPEEDPYSPGKMMPPRLPANIELAEINIPSKQLTFVAFYVADGNACDGKYCLFNLYVKRPDGYQPYLGLNTTKNSYIMVNDKSVSIITCETSAGYNEWRLGDGTLDGPIPPDSPGHFVPVGIFKHDKVAPCPG